MSLDTQTDVTVITEKHFKRLKGTSHRQLHVTKEVIRVYLGYDPGLALALVGCFTATSNQKSIKEVVRVVQGQGDIALLSCQVAENMGPL